MRTEAIAPREVPRFLPPVEPAGQLFSPPYDVPLEGRFVYLDRSTADDVSFSLRLRELSRGNGPGIEIPAVREKEMARSRLALLDVPLNPDSRAHLRIYAGSLTGLLVRFTESGDISRSADLQIYAIRPRWGVHFEQQPGYAEIANLREFVGHLLPGDPPSVTIEILDDGRGFSDQAFWGFVSVTHNASQQVTLITPH